MKDEKLRVLFLIRSLELGGAQRQLIELVRRIDKNRFSLSVVTFYDGGSLRVELKAFHNVELISLHKRSRWDLLAISWRLWRVVRTLKPDIIHSYLGVANELSLLMGCLVGAPVVWGVRASNMELSQYGKLASWAFKAGAWLSRFPDLIIVNSQAGKQHHAKHGYRIKRMVVIPNGIDTQRFHHDPKMGQQFRNQWGILPQQFIIGLIGRLDPMKDHRTFLKAAVHIGKQYDDVRFICIGDGPKNFTDDLHKLGQQLGLEKKLIWAGEVLDMPSVYNALDIVTSSSLGEGFSNAIGEAMACGVPCVVTDVGDSAFIVGKTGTVVPPQDPEALAEGWEKLLSLSPEERRKWGHAARARIQMEFTTKKLATRTESALLNLIPEMQTEQEKICKRE